VRQEELKSWPVDKDESGANLKANQYVRSSVGPVARMWMTDAR
jgi:hypothetical protein